MWPALWRPVQQLSSALVHLLLGITAMLLMLGVFFVITAGDAIQVFSSYAGKLSYPALVPACCCAESALSFGSQIVLPDISSASWLCRGPADSDTCLDQG